jgi:hypothetical protein
MDKHLFMIGGTLKEIGKIYKPGMVAMIKESRPGSWAYITGTERKINAAALNGDTPKLARDLKNYLTVWKSLAAHHRSSGKPASFSQRKGVLPLHITERMID